MEDIIKMQKYIEKLEKENNQYKDMIKQLEEENKNCLDGFEELQVEIVGLRAKLADKSIKKLEGVGMFKREDERWENRKELL